MELVRQPEGISFEKLRHYKRIQHIVAYNMTGEIAHACPQVLPALLSDENMEIGGLYHHIPKALANVMTGEIASACPEAVEAIANYCDPANSGGAAEQLAQSMASDIAKAAPKAVLALANNYRADHTLAKNMTGGIAEACPEALEVLAHQGYAARLLGENMTADIAKAAPKAVKMLANHEDAGVAQALADCMTSEIAKTRTRPSVLTVLFNRGIEVTVPESDKDLRRMVDRAQSKSFAAIAQSLGMAGITAQNGAVLAPVHG